MGLDRLDILDPRPREQFPVSRLNRPGRGDGATRAHVERVVNLLTRAGEGPRGGGGTLGAFCAVIKVSFWRNWTRIGLGLGCLWAIFGCGGYCTRFGLGLDYLRIGLGL